MRTCVVTTLLVFMLLVTSAAARQVEDWPYERLFREADVVVIASAQGTVESDDKLSEGQWKESLIGQRTPFTVISTLKGQTADNPVTVVHFKIKAGVATQNGPRLVTFRTEGPTIEGGGSVKYKVQLSTPQYLLFLKRSAGNLFELVSGQIDPTLSAKEIYAPLPDVIDK